MWILVGTFSFLLEVESDDKKLSVVLYVDRISIRILNCRNQVPFKVVARLLKICIKHRILMSCYL